MKLLRLPIAAKAVLLIAALGLLSIAANVFCLQRFTELQRLSAQVTQHLAPARLALAEAKGAMESFGVRPTGPIRHRIPTTSGILQRDRGRLLCGEDRAAKRIDLRSDQNR